MLFASDLAIGQSSTEPIQRLPEVNLWRPLLGFPLTQTAWAAALVRVGTCYESPVTETPGLQGCLEDHATGTVQNTGPACGRHDREAAGCRRKFWKGLRPTGWKHHRPRVISAKLLLCTTQILITTTITHREVQPAEPIGSHRTERWGRLEGDELYPRGNHLGSSASHRRLYAQERGAQQAGQPPLSRRRTGPQRALLRRCSVMNFFLRPFNRPSHSPSDMGLPRSTLWGGSGARLYMPTNSFVW